MENAKELSPVELALRRAGKAGKHGPDEPWDSDTLLATYVELAKERESAKAWLKRVEAAKDALEPDVVTYFEEEEKQKDTRRGRTIYIAREVWPKIVADDLEEALPPGASKELRAEVAERAKLRLIEALQGDPETEHLVRATYNGQTLRSWILKDLPEDPETFMPIIPDHLEGKLGAVEKNRAKVLKS